MMWHQTSLIMRGITSRLIRRSLFCLLLVSTLLSHQNPFSMTLLTVSFIKSLSQYVLMNVLDVMSQIISVKTAQSFKLTNQLRLRRLSSSLTISSLIKILRSNIPAVMMMMIPQKMIWIFQKTLMLHKKCYEVQSII